MNDEFNTSARDALHPFVQVLALSNVEDCVKIEDEAFPANERCSREKFIYRLSVCPELSLGLYSIPPGSSAFERNSSASPILLGHIVSTKTTSLTVSDSSMDYPREGHSSTDYSLIGHREEGKTIALHSLAISTEHQRKGLGSTLMKSYLERMKHSGIADRIALLAHEHLISFYESFGFVKRGESAAQFGGGGWFDMGMVLSFKTARAALRAPRNKAGLDPNFALMRTSGEDELLNLDVWSSMTIGDLKAVVQEETHISSTALHLFHNGLPLTDLSQTLEQIGINGDDMLGAQVVAPPPPQQQPQSRSQSRREPDPESLRLQILGDPRVREEIQRRAPELANLANDSQRFREFYLSRQREGQEDRARREREIQRLNDNIFDPDAQRRIEELIQQQNIQENLQTALDYNPEAFARVTMLYVDVEVNGHKVKAFVDSGAQATIISPDCAETCGMTRLIDRRYEGTAIGVGTAKILGRIHSAMIKVGTMFLPVSFTVMEGKGVDLLFGLDMLKRHQGVIDLKRNLLCFGDNEVPFLGEADIPRPHEEPMVQGPGGTQIGAESGALSAQDQGIAPAPSSSRPAPSSAQPTQSSAHSFPAEKIQALTDMGFSAEQAERALEATGGNLEQAAAILWDS
ncbi:MAG: DNA damage-inducible protein 1 [Cirrosporium novae-zelandiae]|nr:MAG: DNA damage-inducible protein 1 [Cirrosporium novae-zelandiae]